MGDEADDILQSFNLTEEDRKKYEKVKEQFEKHFIPCRNERANFNRRVQQEGEPVDSFITSLYRLAEHCEYGLLKEDDQYEIPDFHRFRCRLKTRLCNNTSSSG